MKQLAKALVLAFGLGPWMPAADGTLAGAPWTREDTWWEVSYAALVAMDCGQSCQMQKLHLYERNPVLPRHPNARSMRMICLGSVLGHAAVSYVLPVKWRRPFQMGTVFLEAGTVADNYFRAGVSIKF
jgi:hypothetical protein